jgi:hypothetical protein
MRRAWPWNRDRTALIAALVLPTAVSAILVPLREHLPASATALIVVVSIVAVAANGHRLAGLVAAGSAAIWFDFFLTAPYERFSIASHDDLETTVLLLLVGGAVTELAVRGRRHKAAAAIDAGYLTAITSTADLAGAGVTRAVLVDHVSVLLTDLLSLRSCRFESDRFGGMPQLLADGEIVAGDLRWGADSDVVPTGQIEIRAESDERSYGRFVVELTPGLLPPLPARQVAGVLANQVGAALAPGHPTRR